MLRFFDLMEQQVPAFKKAFGGKQHAQMIHPDPSVPGFVRERVEDLMCLSLEVKNMAGVSEALDKFVEKETIDGYEWNEGEPVSWNLVVSMG